MQGDKNMRITRDQLYAIIKEERNKLLKECGCEDKAAYHGNDYNDQEEETGMVSGNLRSLSDKAGELAEMMEQSDSIEEWVQEKIAIAESMIDSIYDYLKYNEQEIDEQSDYVGMDPAHYDEEDYNDDGLDSYDDEYQYQIDEE